MVGLSAKSLILVQQKAISSIDLLRDKPITLPQSRIQAQQLKQKGRERLKQLITNRVCSHLDS